MEEFKPELNKIRSALTESEKLIQLAEECAELAQAALKLSRALGGNNPARKSLDECRADLNEEFVDVMLAAGVYGLKITPETMGFKITRWAGVVNRE